MSFSEMEKTGGGGFRALEWEQEARVLFGQIKCEYYEFKQRSQEGS